VGRQRRGQIDRAGALGAVKAPDGLRAQRIHIDGFAAVAPAGVTVMVTPTFWLLNFSSQAADSAMPAMQVSAITHSICAPQA
jgi:hypothetical protein